MATYTKWGFADFSQVITKGITWYSTPSHGGYHLSTTMQAKMPDYMKRGGYGEAEGWYEEDSAWCKVVTVFPEYFDEKTREQAKQTLRSWYTEAYELFYNEKVEKGEHTLIKY